MSEPDDGSERSDDRPREIPAVSEPESLRDLIEPLIPLAERMLTNQDRALEANRELGQTQLEMAREELHFAEGRFNKTFWLLALVSVAVLALSAGIIFVQDELSAGLLVLSHVGAVVAGLLAGATWQRHQATGQGGQS